MKFEQNASFENMVQSSRTDLLENGLPFKGKWKKEFFKKHGKGESDTGSAEGQIALFTYRISHLTQHLKANKKDYNTQRSLIRLVGKRRSQLDYLKDKDIERYRAIIKKLKIRR